MDVCHGPDCPSLKTSDGRTIDDPAVLALYHNGPYWGRLTSRETERLVDGKRRKKEVPEMPGPKRSMTTQLIIDHAKAGKTAREICNELGLERVKVDYAINRGRQSGELPRPGEGARRRPAPKPATPAEPAPALPSEIVALAPAVDLARLHDMIDLAARMPALRASLLKSCEEIETAARYQLSLAAGIREVVGA